MPKSYFVFLITFFLLSGCQTFYEGHLSQAFSASILDGSWNATNNADLEPVAVDYFQQGTTDLYQLPDEYLTDFMVAMVRTDILVRPQTQELAKILFSVGLANRQAAFNCELFLKKLIPIQKKILNHTLGNHPYPCNNKGYTIDEATRSFDSVFNNHGTKTPKGIDLHWALFSATGDVAILKRFLDKYLEGPPNCLSCIKWSFSSYLKRNADVRVFFQKYMSGKPPEQQKKLEVILNFSVPEREQ